MPSRQTPFTNGVPELLLLRLLGEKEMYGYELVRAVREATDGQLPYGEGVLYPLLHGLEADGLLRSRSQAVKGRTRHYYRLTRKGARRLAELSGEFERVHEVVSTILRRPGVV